ncbi:MAG TPA: DinB family protein, partial [Bacteroidia bacterium]|nr:DinB family protein [Bacteroidia bacterium]
MIQIAETLTETGFTALVKDYTVYNQWANTTLVRWLRTKPLDVLEKEIPSSFPGIKNTIVHIWDVERGWL